MSPRGMLVMKPRRFGLMRRGICVAQGVCFDDHVTVIHWRGEHPSTVVWERYEDFQAVSVTNHPGQGEIVWWD